MLSPYWHRRSPASGNLSKNYGAALFLPVWTGTMTACSICRGFCRSAEIFESIARPDNSRHMLIDFQLMGNSSSINHPAVQQRFLNRFNICLCSRTFLHYSEFLPGWKWESARFSAKLPILPERQLCSSAKQRLL